MALFFTYDSLTITVIKWQEQQNKILSLILSVFPLCISPVLPVISTESTFMKLQFIQTSTGGFLEDDLTMKPSYLGGDAHKMYMLLSSLLLKTSAENKHNPNIACRVSQESRKGHSLTFVPAKFPKTKMVSS